MSKPGSDRRIDYIEFNVGDIARSRAFYGAARGDEVLGPLFERVDDWEAHIVRICAFWSSVTLMTGR